MNKLILFLIFTVVVYIANGQSFSKQYYALVAKKDTVGQLQVLENWEKADANDPELYVAFFNFYVNKSHREILRLDSEMHGEEGLMIKNQDSSQTEPVGYLYEETYYDQDILKKGMDYIANGINKFPNRLDLRFGEIYMLGQIEDYENFTKQIIQAVNYSATNNDAWTWSNSKPVEDSKAFFLSSLQDYQVQLYNTESDEQLENMKRIAEAILNHYPDHVESLSNLAVVYLLNEQYDQALQPLLKAEKINPKDAIVLNNIAQTYKLMGETKKAIKYYKRTIKYGDAETKDYAQEQIDRLQGKSKATF